MTSVNNKSSNGKQKNSIKNNMSKAYYDKKTRKIYAIAFIGLIIFGIVIITSIGILQELKIYDTERFYGTWRSEINNLTFFENGKCKIYNYTGTFDVSDGLLLINYTGVTNTFLEYEYSFSDDYNILSLIGPGSWEPIIYTKQ
ncbi:MAG: hypothetical protein AYK22_04475 [Thermoplasmatales archaeon SG8-52-3]|nr:MAG: hypothetical protein AYK22_04475 [Thermoplasmatales archaeon SG8-52-3]